MTRRWTASLEGRLIVRLVAITLVASTFGFAGLVLKSYRIAQGLSDEGEADVFVGEFLKEVGWAFPLFALIFIGIVVLTVRTSLRPVIAASRQVAVIAPGRTDVRLNSDGVPDEILPFVAAVNAALDRLDKGYETQRRFTADAAHELRTPLAILTAGLDRLPESSEVATLRVDAARMARLVEQLLHVARLDVMPTPKLEKLNLNVLAADLVGNLAPWAHGQGKSLEFEAPDQLVEVIADADSLGGALQNLIENAVFHAGDQPDILIRVAPDASISVVDHGPGIPTDQVEQAFARFWRGANAGRPGAGLGLAIVSTVAAAHSGSVRHEQTPGGGATFVLQCAAYNCVN